MDDIFNRWIETGNISENDIIPILLEYHSLYGTGQVSPEECLALVQFITNTPFFNLGEILVKALKEIARSKNGQLVEVYNNGQLLRRYWYES